MNFRFIMSKEKTKRQKINNKTNIIWKQDNY
nr:MAG TPA: hypothetical protein [Caudoviricetes sp.]